MTGAQALLPVNGLGGAVTGQEGLPSISASKMRLGNAFPGIVVVVVLGFGVE